MITDVDDYFTKGCGRCDRFDTPACSSQQWVRELGELRRICRLAGLAETAKWGHPCYMHAGRNIALIGAFRSDARLSFFNAGLLKDPEGILERQGPNTRNPDMIRFDAHGQVTAREAVILAYLREAMGYAEQGRRPPKSDDILNLPDELVEALDADPELAEAFHALTPGRRKGYVLALAAAKKPETRVARIASFRGRILDGKGPMDR